MTDTTEAAEALKRVVDTFGEDPTNVDRLHPDLRPYVVILDFLGVSLKHPLVYSVPFFSWKYANQMYAQKKNAVQQALRDKDWSRVLVMHERPHRMPKLHEFWQQGVLSEEQLRELLADTWRDTEFPHQYGDIPLDLFAAAGYVTDGPPRPTRPLVVYRGQERGYPPGLSWTTKRATALWFAKRFSEHRGTGVVLRAVAPPLAVLARLPGRGESEVVVNPTMVRITHTEEVV